MARIVDAPEALAGLTAVAVFGVFVDVVSEVNDDVNLGIVSHRFVGVEIAEWIVGAADGGDDELIDPAHGQRPRTPGGRLGARCAEPIVVPFTRFETCGNGLGGVVAIGVGGQAASCHRPAEIRVVGDRPEHRHIALAAAHPGPEYDAGRARIAACNAVSEYLVRVAVGIQGRRGAAADE